jgi:putative Ca2+/H+ antiporter (TMEM165/GDT1 family)
MNFWTGIIIGVIVGANIGMVVAGVLAVSKRSNYADVFQPAQYPMDAAVINDATA